MMSVLAIVLVVVVLAVLVLVSSVNCSVRVANVCDAGGRRKTGFRRHHQRVSAARRKGIIIKKVH